ncbi:MAG: hypothetical protein EB127_19535, partial [Alphaproteobacteria bacterium]|nr:hypothetical protein [Alphaproteobacteria bacterium]
WLPTHYTLPLSDDYPTDGDKIINIAQALWRLPERHDELLVLTDWQKDLIRRVLERYPDTHPEPSKAGRLRYKQVVISMPRKNGKSLIGALFALYGMLLHEPAPEVISVAASSINVSDNLFLYTIFLVISIYIFILALYSVVVPLLSVINTHAAWLGPVDLVKTLTPQ